jgi:WD40 repeat protein
MQVGAILRRNVVDAGSRYENSQKRAAGREISLTTDEGRRQGSMVELPHDSPMARRPPWAGAPPVAARIAEAVAHAAAHVHAAGIVHRDTKPGNLVAALPSHPHWGQACRFSPDGSRLATSCRDGVVRVFDAATGTFAAKVVGHAGRVWDSSRQMPNAFECTMLLR